jgi:hypothetical protein
MFGQLVVLFFAAVLLFRQFLRLFEQVFGTQLGQRDHIVRGNYQGCECGLQSRLGLIDLTRIDKPRDGLNCRRICLQWNMVGAILNLAGQVGYERTSLLDFSVVQIRFGLLNDLLDGVRVRQQIVGDDVRIHRCLCQLGITRDDQVELTRGLLKGLQRHVAFLIV